MPSEPIAMMRSTAAERDRRPARAHPAIGLDRLDDVADKGAVLRPARREARRLVAAPHDAVGGVLDVGDLVAVLRSACSRRNRGPASRARANAAPIENRTALPSPPPTSSTVSPEGVSVGVPVGPIRIDRLARLQAGRRDRRSRPSRARSSIAGPPPCRSRRRSAPGPPSPGSCRRSAAPSVS